MTDLSPDPGHAERTARWLRALNDEMFAGQVTEDAHGRLDAEAAAGLRHSLVRRRWLAEIQLKLTDIQRQFAARKSERGPEAKEWRLRALSWQERLLTRRNEARRLLAEERAVAAVHREEDLSARRRRGEIGESAIARLIDAHRGEFDRLLAEEYLSAGVPLPRAAVERAMGERVSGEQALAALREAGVLRERSKKEQET